MGPMIGHCCFEFVILLQWNLKNNKSLRSVIIYFMELSLFQLCLNRYKLEYRIFVNAFLASIILVYFINE